MIVGIDPGYKQSGYMVLSDRGKPLSWGIEENGDLVSMLPAMAVDGETTLYIEMLQNFGKVIGKESLHTCVWVGRFAQAWEPFGHWVLVTRSDVKMHLCGIVNGVNDARIRQALIDRYGPDKATAIGLKKNPGPLYGVKSHVWQALAVAVVGMDKGEG